MTTATIGERTGDTYAGTEDACLVAAFPTTNYPAQGGSADLTLIRMSGLSSIAASVTVSDSFFKVYVGSGSPVSGDITFKRVLRAWVETQATFNAYSTGNNWAVPGCLSDGADREASSSCVAAYGGGYSTGELTSTSNALLISNTEAMINGSMTNNGYLTDHAALGIAYSLPASGSAATQSIEQTVVYTAGGGGGATTTKDVQEAIGVTDQITDWLRRTRLNGESVTISDAISRSAIRGRFVSESITAADSIVQWHRRTRGIDESATAQDSNVWFLRRTRLAEDTLTVVDSFIKAVSGAGIINTVIVSESVTLTDQAGRVFVLNRQVLELITSTDNLTRYLERQRLASDGLTVSDEFAYWLRRVRAMTESVEISDGIATIRWSRKTVEEYLGITDSVVSTYIPLLQYIYDVRIRLGMDDMVRLGKDDSIRLGMDSPITLGGYN